MHFSEQKSEEGDLELPVSLKTVQKGHTPLCLHSLSQVLVTRLYLAA